MPLVLGYSSAAAGFVPTCASHAVLEASVAARPTHFAAAAYVALAAAAVLAYVVASEMLVAVVAADVVASIVGVDVAAVADPAGMAGPAVAADHALV